MQVCASSRAPRPCVLKGVVSNATPTLTTESPPPVPARGSFSRAQEKGPLQDSGKSDICRMRFLVCVLGGYRQDHRDVHSLMGWSQLTPWRVVGLFQNSTPRGEWSAPGAQASSTGGRDLGARDFMSPAAPSSPALP